MATAWPGRVLPLAVLVALGRDLAARPSAVAISVAGPPAGGRGRWVVAVGLGWPGHLAKRHDCHRSPKNRLVVVDSNPATSAET
jgi:hypothetical protein